MRPTLAATLLLASLAVAAQPAPKADSPFVFSATITATNASNLQLLPPGPTRAIARVGEIFRATPSLADFSGALITIELPPNVALEKGQEAFFFTTPFMYGESVAVRADDVVPGRGADDKKRSEVRAAVQRSIDAPLVTNLARARTVFVGTVMSVRAAQFDLPNTESEHDPKLMAADLRIEQILKGNPPPRTTALFSSSIDVVWYRAPKLQPGDRRIFLLQDDELPELKLPVPTVLDPLDALPLSELERVATLLRGLR